MSKFDTLGSTFKKVLNAIGILWKACGTYGTVSDNAFDSDSVALRCCRTSAEVNLFGTGP